MNRFSVVIPLTLWSGSAMALNTLVIGTGGNMATQYAYSVGDVAGSYTNMTPSDFNALSLTDIMSYDVIMVVWSTSDELDVSWETKIGPFVEAGGGFWYDGDPNNRGDLYPLVTDSIGESCGPSWSLVDTVPGLTDGITNEFVNCHVAYNAWDSRLSPLLQDGTGQTIMLYGDYGGGRVVLSGPDHDYHATKDGGGDAGNQYRMVLNILNWVSDGCDAVDWYADADSDGYGDAASSVMACEAPAGYVADSSDCNDGDAAVNPGASEICDGIDNNCDGLTDPDDSTDALTWYSDFDGDGYGDPDPAYSTLSCDLPSGYVASATDCNDGDSSINPAAFEVCDGIDNDCDGRIDPSDSVDATTWYEDFDGDGYGDPSLLWTVDACVMPDGYTSAADATDCNDIVAAINPGADEVCDEVDNDCDGATDPSSAIDASTWYADSDGDTYGDADSTDVACYESDGWVADATDCNDTDAAINPGAVEICDGIDNNCDGDIDPDDSADASTWYADSDADTYGDPMVTFVSCEVVDGWVADASDCDDTDPAINPDAVEVCDRTDNDCDGRVDGPDSDDAGTWYPDNDGDGFGLETIEEICEDAVVECDTGIEDTGICTEEVCTDVSSAVSACDTPEGYVGDNTDCDDADADVYPDAPGLDADCNELVVEDTGGADDTGTVADDTGDVGGDDTGEGGADDADADGGSDTGDSDKLDIEDCGCATGSLQGSSPWLALLALFGLARRRQV